MKKAPLAILVSMLSLAATAYAQSPSTEIRESTDPAKAAEVEQRAADIQARQQSGGQDMTSGDSSTSKRHMKQRSRAKKHAPRQPKAGSSGASGAADTSGTSSTSSTSGGTQGSDTGSSK